MRIGILSSTLKSILKINSHAHAFHIALSKAAACNSRDRVRSCMIHTRYKEDLNDTRTQELEVNMSIINLCEDGWLIKYRSLHLAIS